jgi:DNA-binding XRE family transcriptional regulator
MRRNISYGEEHAVTSMGRFFDAMEAKAFSLPNLQRIHNDVASAKASGLLVFPEKRKRKRKKPESKKLFFAYARAEKERLRPMLSQMRLALNMPQKEVAIDMGLAIKTISCSERNTENLSLATMKKLYEYYQNKQNA